MKDDEGKREQSAEPGQTAGEGWFPQTRWTVISAARDGGDPTVSDAVVSENSNLLNVSGLGERKEDDSLWLK